MKMRFTMKVVAVVTVVLLGAGVASAAQIKMMTGPQGGSWYPLGGAIQNIIEKNVPGTTVMVLPGAGISNVKGVQTGKAELGFGNGVSTVDGVNGRAPFDAKTDNVRQLATLYFQYFHMVALADAGIKTPADFGSLLEPGHEEPRLVQRVSYVMKWRSMPTIELTLCQPFILHRQIICPRVSPKGFSEACLNRIRDVSGESAP